MENMERLGSRKIDELGRVTLTSELRSKFGWGEKDTLILYYVDSNTLMLQRAEKYPGAKCVFCGATEVAKSLQGKDVCSGCLGKIMQTD